MAFTSDFVEQLKHETKIKIFMQEKRLRELKEKAQREINIIMMGLLREQEKGKIYIEEEKENLKRIEFEYKDWLAEQNRIVMVQAERERRNGVLVVTPAEEIKRFKFETRMRKKIQMRNVKRIKEAGRQERAKISFNNMKKGFQVKVEMLRIKEIKRQTVFQQSQDSLGEKMRTFMKEKMNKRNYDPCPESNGVRPHNPEPELEPEPEPEPELEHELEPEPEPELEHELEPEPELEHELEPDNNDVGNFVGFDDNDSIDDLILRD